MRMRRCLKLNPNPKPSPNPCPNPTPYPKLQPRWPRATRSSLERCCRTLLTSWRSKPSIGVCDISFWGGCGGLRGLWSTPPPIRCLLTLDFCKKTPWKASVRKLWASRPRRLRHRFDSQRAHPMRQTIPRLHVHPRRHPWTIRPDPQNAFSPKSAFQGFLQKSRVKIIVRHHHKNVSGQRGWPTFVVFRVLSLS